VTALLTALGRQLPVVSDSPGFVSTRVCEYASRAGESSMPNLGVAAVLAKHVSAGHAARGASTAVQILASVGLQDGHVLTRAYRDAKAMEIIAGSNEICRLIPQSTP
jgi:methoxymalonate biosynthesis protein